MFIKYYDLAPKKYKRLNTIEVIRKGVVYL